MGDPSTPLSTTDVIHVIKYTRPSPLLFSIIWWYHPTLVPVQGWGRAVATWLAVFSSVASSGAPSELLTSVLLPACSPGWARGEGKREEEREEGVGRGEGQGGEQSHCWYHKPWKKCTKKRSGELPIFSLRVNRNSWHLFKWKLFNYSMHCNMSVCGKLHVIDIKIHRIQHTFSHPISPLYIPLEEFAHSQKKHTASNEREMPSTVVGEHPVPGGSSVGQQRATASLSVPQSSPRSCPTQTTPPSSLGVLQGLLLHDHHCLTRSLWGRKRWGEVRGGEGRRGEESIGRRKMGKSVTPNLDSRLECLWAENVSRQADRFPPRQVHTFYLLHVDSCWCICATSGKTLSTHSTDSHTYSCIIFIVSWLIGTWYYRIARNFQGLKFSRIALRQILHDIIFEDGIRTYDLLI